MAEKRVREGEMIGENINRSEKEILIWDFTSLYRDLDKDLEFHRPKKKKKNRIDWNFVVARNIFHFDFEIKSFFSFIR